MVKVVQFVVVIFTLLSVMSCKKVEGQGGASSITGKIMIEEKLYVNGVYSTSITYEGSAEDVYLVYGGTGTAPDDKTVCGYDGTFKFEYLQPGTYTVYAYNKIFHTGPNVANNDDDYYTREAVIKTVELGKKETLDLGTISLIN